MIQRIWWWCWCKWTNHKGSMWLETHMVHPVKHQDIYFRSCKRCDNVMESDVRHILDTVEKLTGKREIPK